MSSSQSTHTVDLSQVGSSKLTETSFQRAIRGAAKDSEESFQTSLQKRQNKAFSYRPMDIVISLSDNILSNPWLFGEAQGAFKWKKGHRDPNSLEDVHLKLKDTYAISAEDDGKVFMTKLQYEGEGHETDGTLVPLLSRGFPKILLKSDVDEHDTQTAFRKAAERKRSFFDQKIQDEKPSKLSITSDYLINWLSDPKRIDGLLQNSSFAKEQLSGFQKVAVEFDKAVFNPEDFDGTDPFDSVHCVVKGFDPKMGEWLGFTCFATKGKLSLMADTQAESPRQHAPSSSQAATTTVGSASDPPITGRETMPDLAVGSSSSSKRAGTRVEEHEATEGRKRVRVILDE